MTLMPSNFEKIDEHQLPENVSAKFKIGELVKVMPGNPTHMFGFYLRGGVGVIANVTYYKTLGFKTYSPQVFYMIEYKIKWIENDEYGHVLEHSIKPMEIE